MVCTSRLLRSLLRALWPSASLPPAGSHRADSWLLRRSDVRQRVLRLVVSSKAVFERSDSSPSRIALFYRRGPQSFLTAGNAGRLSSATKKALAADDADRRG